MGSIFPDEKLHDMTTTYRRRLKERFPSHFCELPYTPDRVFPTLPPIPTFRQRVKSCWQHVVVAWRRHPYVPRMRPSNFTLEMEQVQHIRSNCWRLVHPMSRFWMHVSLIVAIANIILLLVLPYDQTFLHVRRFLWGKNDTQSPLPYVFWLDREDQQVEQHFTKLNILQKKFQVIIDFCNGAFYLHIILKFFTGYYDMQHNVVVMEHPAIIKRYLKTWFFPEMIASIPVETAAKYITYQNQEAVVDYLDPLRRTILYTYTALYAFRLIRLYQTFSALIVWGDFYQIPAILIYFLIYFIAYVLFVQWSVFFMVRMPFLVKGPRLFIPDTESWIGEAFYRYLWLNRTSPLTRQYFTAMHRGFGAAGCFSPYIVRGRAAIEDVIVLGLVMWIGMFFSLVLFSLIMRYTESDQFTFTKMKNVYSQILTYVRQRRLPFIMRNKILYCYTHKYSNHYYDEKKILHSFTINMRHAINTSLSRRVVMMSGLFQGTSRALVNKIAAHLIEETYLPYDLVYSSDSEASYLYFLSIGTVAIYLRTGEEVAHMEDGDFFGIMGLVLPECDKKHDESVVALETCQVFKLPRDLFGKFVKPMPQLYSRVRSIAMIRREDLLAKIDYSVPVRTLPSMAQLPVWRPTETKSDTESETDVEDEDTSTSSIDLDVLNEMEAESELRATD